MAGESLRISSPPENYFLPHLQIDFHLLCKAVMGSQQIVWATAPLHTEPVSTLWIGEG